MDKSRLVLILGLQENCYCRKKKVGIVLSHGTVGLRPECVRNYAVDHALEG